MTRSRGVVRSRARRRGRSRRGRPGGTRRAGRGDSCRKMPAIPSLGSPSNGASGRSHPSAIRGAATSACAYSTRQSTTFMKKRSASLFRFREHHGARGRRRRRSRCAPDTKPERSDDATNDIQWSTVGDEAGPGSVPLRATASQPSRMMRSLTARHHGLPAGSGRRRLQDTSAKLPAHERHRRPAIGKVSGRRAERAVIATLHQRDSTCRVVADRVDHLLRPRRGAGRVSHRDMIAPPARSTSNGTDCPWVTRWC